MTRPVQVTGFSYLLLLLVIAAGVTAGNLASSYIQLRIVAAGAQAAAVELERQLQDQQAAARERRRTREQAQRQARAASPTGRQLAQRCADWSVADAERSVPTTRAGVAEHCGRYERYLETGQVQR